MIRYGKIKEVNQLVASDGKKSDYFGVSVAISADGLVAIVGAEGEDTKAKDAGKVYTYKRSNIDADWEEVSQLTASDGEEYDYFGSSVAISADGLVAMIGARGEDTEACGAGKVYTYKRDNIDADWKEVFQLTANDGMEDNYFGSSVAISADGLVAIVGADANYSKSYHAGKVYTYIRDNIDADWEEVNQLLADDSESSNRFGSSVALSANGLVAIVGAEGGDTKAVSGGKVYTYKRSSIDSDWEEISQLTSSDGRENDYFGSSVAISADGLVATVGADGNNAFASNAGKVYTYKRSNVDADWEEVSQLTASDGEQGDWFGAAVALSADGLVVMVGASYNCAKATNAGKVYTYKV